MNAKNLRSFERSLPMSLMRAREAVMRTFLPAIKEHQLSPQQWRVLRALEQENGLQISELSERCFLLMPSLSRIVANLVERGLVTRESVAQDQRKSAIVLTETGRAIYADIAPQSEARYAAIAQKFGPGKLELLYELLDELVDKLAEEET